MSCRESPSLLECQELFRRLQSEFSQEYQLLGLESVAIPAVLPLIRKHFSNWRPLDPDHLIYGVDLMKEWKDILSDRQESAVSAAQVKSFGNLFSSGFRR